MIKVKWRDMASWQPLAAGLQKGLKDTADRANAAKTPFRKCGNPQSKPEDGDHD
jgi:hypothetical protein